MRNMTRALVRDAEYESVMHAVVISAISVSQDQPRAMQRLRGSLEAMKEFIR